MAGKDTTFLCILAYSPCLSFEIIGLTISYCGEFSEDVIVDDEPPTWLNDGGTEHSIKSFHATDFEIDYWASIADTVTIGAGTWYFYFHNEDIYSFIAGTIFVSLDSVPFCPTVTYNHDYYVDSEDKKDYYIQFGIINSRWGHHRVLGLLDRIIMQIAQIKKESVMLQHPLVYLLNQGHRVIQGH